MTQQKGYLVWFEDGLMDIFVGAVLLIMGLQMFVASPYVMPLAILATLYGVYRTKVRVTDVRLDGEIRQQAVAKLRHAVMIFLWAALGFGLFLYVTGEGALAPDGSAGWSRGLPQRLAQGLAQGLALGIFMVIGMGLVARLIPLPRFGVYALLFAGLMAADILLNLPLVYAFVVAGAVLVFLGLGDFSRFKDAHPIKGDHT